MIELRGTALWALALLLSASADSLFAAPFCSGGAALNLCKRCTTRIEHSTPRNRACGIFLKTSDFAKNVVILGSSVVKQAQHGHVQIDRDSWTYTPAKGYAGPDTFLIEWDILSNDKDVFVIYTDQHMTVTQ